MWLGADGDGIWNDLLSMIFAGSAWPEGSETAVWELSQEWIDLADGLGAASEGLQAAAADLLAAWDAPAAEGFDDLARKLLGSPEFGLPGHIQNAVAIAQQTSGFGVELQYAKVSVNVAVAVAAMAAVIAVVMAWAGGLSLAGLGPIASTARQAVIAALDKLAEAAGRKALVEGVRRAVTEQTVALAGRVAAHSTGRHLAYEIAEEVLEELVIDVTTQAWQMADGSRTDWNVLSTVQAGLGGGFGGAAGAGLVAPVFARLRRSPRVSAVAGLGADGGRLARTGNFGIRHTGGLAATAGTNAVASPAGGIAASLLTGQGFPALDGSVFGMAALGAMGRYGTVSPTNPAVLYAAVHPVQTLAQVHVDALAGHLAQQGTTTAAGAASAAGTTSVTTTPGTDVHGRTSPARGVTGTAPSSTAPSSTPATGRMTAAAATGGSSTTAGTTTGSPLAAQPAAATASPTTTTSPPAAPAVAAPVSSAPVSSAPVSFAPVAATPVGSSAAAGPASASVAPAPSSSSPSSIQSPASQSASPGSSTGSASSSSSGQTQGSAHASPTERGAGATGAGLAPADAHSTTEEPGAAGSTSPAAQSSAPVDTAPVAAQGSPVGAAPTSAPAASAQATSAQASAAAAQAEGPTTSAAPTGTPRPGSVTADAESTSGPATAAPTGKPSDPAAEAGTSVDPAAEVTPTETVAVAPARADRIEASLDRLAADLTAIAATGGGGPVSRSDVEQALLHQSAQTESQRTSRVRAREYALREIAGRKAARVAAPTGGGARIRTDTESSGSAQRAGMTSGEGRTNDDGAGALHRGQDVPAHGDGADGRGDPGGGRRPGDGDDAARRGERDAGPHPLLRSAHPSDTSGGASRAVPAPGGRLDGEPGLGSGEPTGVTAGPGSDSGVPQTGPTSAPENGAGDPPVPPPTPEQELYDGMPEPLRRYLMEAVAHGQVWADLVQDQMVDVFARLQEQGLPAPEAVGLVNAVKSLESAARKIQPSIQGGSTFAASIWSMDDLVRFSLQIDPDRYGESVLEALRAFRALGWAAPEDPGPGETHDDWRNTWAIGNRHHGLLVVMTHATTGQRVEMQFPTPQSWAVGKRTHDFYETLRFTKGDPFERVVALGRILDIVRAEGVEAHLPAGLDLLGPVKANGPTQIFKKEPRLAAAFLATAESKFGSVAAALMRAKVSAETAQHIADALGAQTTPATSAPKESNDDGPESPGVASVGTDPAEGPGHVGEVPGDGPARRASDGLIPGASRRPGTGASGHAGAAGGRTTGRREGLHLSDSDLAEAGDQADPGQPLGGGRGAGDDLVRRTEPHLDLGPGERERDRAPGGRGPVRAAGAGHAGAGGGTGPVEGDDAAEPGTPAGDVPQPGGPGAGHVGDLGGPGEVAQPPALTGPLAVGADGGAAWQHVLAEADPAVLWEGADGVLPGQVLLLADGSSVRVNTGLNPWARTDPDRPLQMWTVGAFHLDDGPLTPATSRFLGDLLMALTDPDVGQAGPSSHWLAQRATLDPGTHEIAAPGLARRRVDGAPTLVWDAAQGWVDARRAGALARVKGEELIPAEAFASWVNEPSAVQLVDGSVETLARLRATEQDEKLQTAPGTEEHAAAVEARARRRAELRRQAEKWMTDAVAPAVAQFVDQGVQPLAESNGRVLVELDHGDLAVVTVSVAENDALAGSRPGLQQAGTTSDIGQLRNELAAYPAYKGAVDSLTKALQQGAVRQFRVQGVLADDGFVGMRVTEFEVARPAHDEPGVLRTDVEPQRHIDPGFWTREAMRRAVAGWTPSSVSEAVENALRWLPFVNPHHARFPVARWTPWSNNCGDCSRAVADLLHGRDARAAFGDNGGRVLDDHVIWGTDPGELNEMWRWAGIQPGWHWWGLESATFSTDFTDDADARIGAALASLPEGTVAIVLLGWADPTGHWDGGHWFNAAVTEDGVEWIDGQTADHHAWPPPYTTPYSGYSVITRAQGSDVWVDLFLDGGQVGGGPGSGGAASAVESGGRRSRDVSLLVDYLHRNGRTGAPLLTFDLDAGQLDEGGDPAVAASLSARALSAALADAVVAMAAGSVGNVRAVARQVSPAAAALVSPDGEVTVSTSMRTAGAAEHAREPDLHPVMAAALDRIDPEHRGPGHGRCAEVAVLSDALWQFEADAVNQAQWADAESLRLAAVAHVARSTISVSRLVVDHRRAEDVRFRFEDFPPCSTCEHLVGPGSVFGAAIVPSRVAPLEQPVADWVPVERRVHPGSVVQRDAPVETGGRERPIEAWPPTAFSRGPPGTSAPADLYGGMLADERRTVDAITRSVALKAVELGIPVPTPSDVRQALRHLAADDHLLVDWASVARALGSGHTGSIGELGDEHVRRARFALDPEIIAALSRLVSGRGVRDSDVTLVMHEVVESALRASHPATPHRLLHAAANAEFDWERVMAREDVDPADGRTPTASPQPTDASFAARITNATGDWPEEDDELRPSSTRVENWADGAGSTSMTTVPVDSPGGERRWVAARWVETSRDQRDVLVLAELPGHPFWWSTPEALTQLIDRAREALHPDPDRWATMIVLGERIDRLGRRVMAQLAVSPTNGGGVEATGEVRVLPPAEVLLARSALRLDPGQSTGCGGAPVA
ncbi:YwqJ-related putative deaminase [Klenkia marina]|uniref:WXG100-like domain-containing protein n=1 Tax=Klenkia marina TaxID=1960309 RepID=UPI00105958F1|nr:YwqJ-related putative deaminase [Klenkia marina]